MTWKSFERPMFCELMGLLTGLPEEWKAQGATENELNLSAFDFDYVPTVGISAGGFFNGLAPVVLEDTPEYRIERDPMGRTTKLCKQFASISLPLTYPVKDMDSWLKIKPHYEFSESRLDWNFIEEAEKLGKSGHLIVFGLPGGFDEPRQLMGEEALCVAYYEEPELIHDIMATLERTSLEILSRLARKITIDQLSVHEDMAGKSGPLIGGTQIEEFIKPYFSSVWNAAQAHGAQIFDMDSDGDMNPVINVFLECGLTNMYPMEPAGGMDIVALRKKYGKKLAMKGGIDKHVLRKGKADILAELEYKLQPLMQEGGMVFGLDHRIPNGTPLENYRYYVDTAREMLGIPPRDSSQKGWARMAF